MRLLSSILILMCGGPSFIAFGFSTPSCPSSRRAANLLPLRAFSRRDGDDDDDADDDDDPPVLNDSPQEFLYRMMQQQTSSGDDSDSNDIALPPTRERRSAPKIRPTSFGKKASGGGSKDTTVYVCTNCGSEYVQWHGRCGTCSEWNTIREEQRVARKKPGVGIGGIGGAAAKKQLQMNGSSWLDGISDSGGGYSDYYGGVGGGPVRVTDVYKEILSDEDGGSSSSWEERLKGARERRVAVPNDPELNAVLGGGLMPGSISLVGGDPGVGKSTLLLQMAGSVASMAQRSLQFQGVGMGPPQPSATMTESPAGTPEGEDSSGSNNDNNNTQKKQQQQQQTGLGPVLYISGEENANQIASRALRLGIQDPELLLWCETDADVIVDSVVNSYAASASFDNQLGEDSNDPNQPPLSKLPSLIIIDSIQTMLCDAAGSSSAGGITQVRECVGLFLRLAKSTGVPIMLVGHVTKTGDVAGPRTVEHMVDCVLYLESGGGGVSAFESGSNGSGGMSSLRVLRAAKNRFGSSEEVGVYEMVRDGRLLPISDPSSFFLSTRQDNIDAEGCAISVVLEGIRSMTVEVQALVAWSAGGGGSGGGGGRGRVIVDGISNSRLLLILAVLQKRYGISLHRRDVYVNVVGGMNLRGGKGSNGGGGSDLAVALAVVSSLLSIPVRSDTAFVGEVGLLGELRPVHSLEKRISEARRMGFSRIVIPSSSSSSRKKTKMGSRNDSGPKEVSAGGGIQQLMCENLMDAINCGLVDKLPTRKSRSGPKLKKPKQSMNFGGRSTRDGTKDITDERDIILDDEEDDEMYE